MSFCATLSLLTIVDIFQWFVTERDWCIRDIINAYNFGPVWVDVQTNLYGEAVQSVGLFLEMFKFFKEYSKVIYKVKVFKL